MSVVAAKPTGKFRHIPQFPERYSPLEKAMIVKRYKCRNTAFMRQADALNSEIVASQCGYFCFTQPVQQRLITTVNCRAHGVNPFGVRLFVHLQEFVRKAGMQTQYVSGFNGNSVGIQYGLNMIKG